MWIEWVIWPYCGGRRSIYVIQGDLGILPFSDRNKIVSVNPYRRLFSFEYKVMFLMLKSVTSYIK